MSKRLIIMSSAKGGSGKSTASRAYIDLARQAGRTVASWDLDGQTSSLSMLYPDRDPQKGCGFENIKDLEAPGRWLDSVNGDAQDCLLDVPGGALHDLLRVIHGGAQSLIQIAKEADREVVIVSVIGLKRDSSFAPIEAVRLFGNDVHHIVLKNGFWAPVNGFVVFDGVEVDGVRKYGKPSDIVREAGGTVLYFPKLDHVTDGFLDVENLTFIQATTAGEKIGVRAAYNARFWLNAVSTALAGSWIDVSGNVPGAPPVPSKNGKAVRSTDTVSV